MVNRSYWPNNESWKQYWPYRIIALIATTQLIISFIVVAIQIAIVIIGTSSLCNGVTPRYVMGFVCWGFFIACWISIFCVTCCNRSSVGCATYVLVENILAFIFSCVLIDFDRQFLDNPFFDYNIVNADSCYINSLNDGTNYWSISLSLTKGQLAGTVLILVTSLSYVGIYIYVYIKALNHDKTMTINTFPIDGLPPQMQPPSQVITRPPTIVVHSESSARPVQPTIEHNPELLRHYDTSQIFMCHKCGEPFYTPQHS